MGSVNFWGKSWGFSWGFSWGRSREPWARTATGEDSRTFAKVIPAITEAFFEARKTDTTITWAENQVGVVSAISSVVTAFEPNDATFSSSQNQTTTDPRLTDATTVASRNSVLIVEDSNAEVLLEQTGNSVITS